MKLKLSILAMLLLTIACSNSSGHVAEKSTVKPALKEKGLQRQEMARRQNLPLKKPVKKIAAKTIKTIEGKEVTIGQDKPTLLLLFASYCGHCQRELPAFSKAFAQFKGKLNMVASSSEPMEHIKGFIEEFKAVNLDYFHDADQSLYSMFANRAVPHVILIDKNGKVKRHEAGWDSKYMSKFTEQIKSLL